ncbi:hypothetical protein ABI309_11685 [Citrobacter youngae]|jgi:hypothetical protein|uniref:hypothetical protein n=1 Tax=Klebsiella TaxID=570 RepID=UPI0011416512|nr:MULTISPECIES: hypothetical protein [Klebsiella]HEM8065563.1 hypothetical protein [Enterobacter hormaechei]NGE22165.1 hypothetical protein [Klebsiella pneumoniae]TYX14366.1 hypothetical protein FCG72_025355 [Klebsiella pneumoniae]WPS03141.1 hypothetical protein SM908_21935 [Klebsiella aerogenes]HBY2284643.1 hypothetical protein [Klebsiella pneumoniae]
MAVYQINYDLRKQKDYASLIERIKGYPNWCHPLESTWIVVTNQSGTQIRDHLNEVMDDDDGLLVTRLQWQWAGSGLSKEIYDWLKSQSVTSAF